MKNDMTEAVTDSHEHLFAKRAIRRDKFGAVILGQKCVTCGTVKAKNLRTGYEAEAASGEFSKEQCAELLKQVTLPLTC